MQCGPRALHGRTLRDAFGKKNWGEIDPHIHEESNFGESAERFITQVQILGAPDYDSASQAAGPDRNPMARSHLSDMSITFVCHRLCRRAGDRLWRSDVTVNPTTPNLPGGELPRAAGGVRACPKTVEATAVEHGAANGPIGEIKSAVNSAPESPALLWGI